MSAVLLEELPDVNEADLDEEVEDHSDYSDSEQKDGPEAQFREAVNIIRTRNESFKDPEALYEFLFKYRDILEYSSPVYGTLLHSIARTTPEEYSNIAALAKRLIQEHPQLLCKVDGEGLTPVSMASNHASRQLVRMLLRTCADDPNCRHALEEALQVPDSEGRTALHHLSRAPSKFKASLILKVLAFATDEALGVQDGSGRTPLHCIVSSDHGWRSKSEVVQYFLTRDDEIQESSPSRHSSREPVHTFLDVMDASGLSVYQCLLSYMESRKRRNKLPNSDEHRLIPLMQSPKGSSRVPEAQGSDTKNDAEKPDSMRLQAERSGGQAANISLVRKDSLALAGEARPAVTESKLRRYAEISRESAEIFSSIAQLIKLHYIQTRDIARASRFLYGDNTEDIQLYFNYTGGPPEVKKGQFEATFAATRFCDILKFVSFPASVSVIQDTRLGSNVSMTRTAGHGRRDMEFFSDWLQRKGVRHIISMQVYDFNPCHSDKSIGSVLRSFKIEDLDWRKIDLDPRTIQEACNEVQRLTLWWSGNNTALRAWSEPNGLPALPHLKEIRICLPREIQAVDSLACVENNIAEFQRRLKTSLDSQAGDIEPTDHDATNASTESNDEKASSSASKSKPRSIQVQFNASKALSTGLGEPASETQEIAIPRRWLRCVHNFSRSFSEIWDEVLKMRDGHLNETDGPVVALIDDGVDVLDASIPPGTVNGGASFEVEAGHRLRPWYASYRGHGTMVASLITWICPMAKLYSIRVGLTERNEVDMGSLAMALESAVAKRATIIILGCGINYPHHHLPEMNRVFDTIHKAYSRQIILLRPLLDLGFSAAGESDVWQRFWGILPTQDERTRVLNASLERSRLVLPGTNDVVSHLSENNSSNFAGLLGVLGRVSEDDSSVATALAAGLISTLICCYKLIVSFEAARADSSAREESERSLNYVMQHAGMEAVLNNLGDLTKDGVVKVWQTLDPVNEILGDKSRSVEEKVDQLAILTRHLALGLRP